MFLSFKFNTLPQVGLGKLFSHVMRRICSPFDPNSMAKLINFRISEAWS